jgi:hypothetical protein
MKPISLTVHGAIDYLAVVIFAVAPAAIGGLKTLYYPFDFLWGD